MLKKFIGIATFVAFVFFGAEARAQERLLDGNAIMTQPMRENLCALTFDDGPSPYTTPILLDILKAYGIRATFFMLGKNASYYPDVTRRVIEEGHEIGNHSWSHPNLKKLSYESQAREIEDTDAVLRELGATPLYMRPPYGNYDDRTREIAERLGVSIILWSHDTKDWKRIPEDYTKVASTRGEIGEEGRLYGVFLFHDIHKTTVEDAPRMIEQLRSGGCDRFVTISEYFGGLPDPEAPALMSRRPLRIRKEKVEPALKYAAGEGVTPLARASQPWSESSIDLALAGLKLSGGSGRNFAK